jgi:hypothetical protein
MVQTNYNRLVKMVRSDDQFEDYGHDCPIKNKCRNLSRRNICLKNCPENVQVLCPEIVPGRPEFVLKHIFVNLFHQQMIIVITDYCTENFIPS